MQVAIVFLTLAAYTFAGYLWWHDKSPNYVVALAAGQLGTLFSPLWQWLYRFAYNPVFGPLANYLDRDLPSIVLFGGWIAVLPALLVFYLYRARWWFPSYIAGLLTFVVFIIFHLLIEAIGTRTQLWSYDRATTLPAGLQMTLLSAIMNALVSLGTLSSLLVTRRYALTSLLLLLLPTPLVLGLFVHGLLGAPLYAALFLQSQNLASGWATLIGTLGTVSLLLWSAHTVASVIESIQLGRRAVA